MAFREAYGEARKREVAKVSRQPEPESEEASKPPLGVEGVAKEQFAPVALTPSIESNGALGQPRKFPFAPVVSGVFVAGEVLGLIGSRFLGARRRHWTEKAAGDRFAIYVAFLDEDRNDNLRLNVIDSIKQVLNPRHVQVLRAGILLKENAQGSDLAAVKSARRLLRRKGGHLLIWGRVSREGAMTILVLRVCLETRYARAILLRSRTTDAA